MDLERWMRRLARLDDTPLDPREAYARYREWLPFAHRTNAFVETVLEDLGREPNEFSRDPGARLFEVP